MAVFTPLSLEEISAHLVAYYDLGALQSATAVASGVENTTYHLVAGNTNYILTLYEGRTSREALPFIFGMMAHLRAQGVLCPDIMRLKDGALVSMLKGKPAIVQSFIVGRDVAPDQITPQIAREAGAQLAQMHLATTNYAQTRPNQMSFDAWRDLQDDTLILADTVEAGLGDLMIGAMGDVSGLFFDTYPQAYPHGAIHGDFFPDNVFFHNGVVSGVIDFNFACTDAYVYDLAVAYNAWCFDGQGAFLRDVAIAFLTGYEAFRPLSVREADDFHLFGQAAAIRILSTRLYDWLNQPASALLAPKDPRPYAEILRTHKKK